MSSLREGVEECEKNYDWNHTPATKTPTGSIYPLLVLPVCILKIAQILGSFLIATCRVPPSFQGLNLSFEIHDKAQLPGALDEKRVGFEGLMFLKGWVCKRKNCDCFCEFQNASKMVVFSKFSHAALISSIDTHKNINFGLAIESGYQNHKNRHTRR